ncbi:hypothetical protein PH4a_08910 [Proteus hauseri]|nr:hypothetical protein PH4a_08910 [Proteus hauseri]
MYVIQGKNTYLNLSCLPPYLLEKKKVENERLLELIIVNKNSNDNSSQLNKEKYNFKKYYAKHQTIIQLFNYSIIQLFNYSIIQLFNY